MLAAVLLAPGRVLSEPEDAPAEELAEAVAELFEEAQAAAGPGAAPVGQVEVATAEGVVFAVRQAGLTLAAVTDRLALPSLMFYDLRSILSELEAKAA